MKCLKHSVIATTAAVFLLVPAMGTASPNGALNEFISRGNIETSPGFDVGTDAINEFGNRPGPRVRLANRTDATPQVSGVTPEACNPVTEPVLWEGPQAQYYIKWCRKFNSNPKWAKQNYYYVFANGDMALVATLKYSCDNPADVALMAPGVWEGACQ